MSKNKTLTYTLIAASILIWGTIIYKIIHAVSSSDNIKRTTIDRRGNNDYNRYLVADSFSLIANYRDPFLGNFLKSKNAEKLGGSGLGAKATVKVKELQPDIDWNIIKYQGIIINPKNKKKVSLVVINGKEYLMTEGQTEESFTLIRNYTDSIKVVFMKKVKFIKK